MNLLENLEGIYPRFTNKISQYTQRNLPKILNFRRKFLSKFLGGISGNCGKIPSRISGRFCWESLEDSDENLETCLGISRSISSRISGRCLWESRGHSFKNLGEIPLEISGRFRWYSSEDTVGDPGMNPLVFPPGFRWASQ